MADRFKYIIFNKLTEKEEILYDLNSTAYSAKIGANKLRNYLKNEGSYNGMLYKITREKDMKTKT